MNIVFVIDTYTDSGGGGVATKRLVQELDVPDVQGIAGELKQVIKLRLLPHSMKIKTIPVFMKSLDL